jgi:hypothetical protein
VLLTPVGAGNTLDCTLQVRLLPRGGWRCCLQLLLELAVDCILIQRLPGGGARVLSLELHLLLRCQVVCVRKSHIH